MQVRISVEHEEMIKDIIKKESKGKPYEITAPMIVKHALNNLKAEYYKKGNKSGDIFDG